MAPLFQQTGRNRQDLEKETKQMVAVEIESVSTPCVVDWKQRPCVEWTGGTDGRGYGRKTVKGVRERTHRMAWEARRGPIPEGKCVLHRCDNRLCMNVAHLFLGTYSDNERDKVAKGRHRGQKRTCCPKGHPLVAGNLRRSELKRGRRACLSCGSKTRHEKLRLWRSRHVLLYRTRAKQAAAVGG